VKRRLVSRVITEGVDRAPHRAFLRAMGHDDAAIAQPFAGIVSTGASVTPCSMSLGPQVAVATKALPGKWRHALRVLDHHGRRQHGNEPCGNALQPRFARIDRRLIEAVMYAHAYDGLIGFAGCDKTLSGILLAMVRINRPSVFMYGGPPFRRWRGPRRRQSSMSTKVWAACIRRTERIGIRRARALRNPHGRILRSQFTANTMAMVAEGPRHCPTRLGHDARGASDRPSLAESASKTLFAPDRQRRPRSKDLITRASLENAQRPRLRRPVVDQRSAAFAGDRARSTDFFQPR